MLRQNHTSLLNIRRLLLGAYLSIGLVHLLSLLLTFRSNVNSQLHMLGLGLAMYLGSIGLAYLVLKGKTKLLPLLIYLLCVSALPSISFTQANQWSEASILLVLAMTAFFSLGFSYKLLHPSLFLTLLIFITLSGKLGLITQPIVYLLLSFECSLFFMSAILRQSTLKSLSQKEALNIRQAILDNQSLELRLCLEEKSSLLSVINQEFVSKTSMISSYTDLLSRRQFFKQEKADEWIHKIEDLCMEMELSLNQIRDLEALYNNSKSYKPESISIVESLEQAMQIARENAEEKNIKFNMQVLGAENPHVLADQRGLAYQVFLNLISNAIKYSFTDSSIEIRVQTLENYVLVSIKDSGIGIPEALQHQIIDKNSHYTSLGTSGEGGRGFGLTIAQSYIKMFGGTLSIESTHESIPNNKHGTCVEIRLPKSKFLEKTA